MDLKLGCVLHEKISTENRLIIQKKCIYILLSNQVENQNIEFCSDLFFKNTFFFYLFIRFPLDTSLHT
jgi:hypothetical protein